MNSTSSTATISNSFFSIWVFFHEHSRFTGQQGREKGISSTTLYHFHSFHRHQDIIRQLLQRSHLWTHPATGGFSAQVTKIL